MITIRITYSKMTPKSAETGEFSDTGWRNEEGLKFTSPEEAAEYLQSQGACSSEFHPGMWYDTEAEREDLGSDEETFYSFHIEAPDGVQEKIYNILQE